MVIVYSLLRLTSGSRALLKSHYGRTYVILVDEKSRFLHMCGIILVSKQREKEREGGLEIYFGEIVLLGDMSWFLFRASWDLLCAHSKYGIYVLGPQFCSFVLFFLVVVFIFLLIFTANQHVQDSILTTISLSG